MTTLDELFPQLHPLCPGRVLGPSGVRGPCLVTLAPGEDLCPGHVHTKELGIDPDEQRVAFAVLIAGRRPRP